MRNLSEQRRAGGGEGSGWAKVGRRLNTGRWREQRLGGEASSPAPQPLRCRKVFWHHRPRARWGSAGPRRLFLTSPPVFVLGDLASCLSFPRTFARFRLFKFARDLIPGRLCCLLALK